MSNYILLIETATERCSVAISKGKQVLYSLTSENLMSHASQLTILIEQALKAVDLTPAALEAIAVSNGPGSYTGAADRGIHR
ncbi:MAG: hypothetical protein AAF598_14290 [Bacteroidota bacterium]